MNRVLRRGIASSLLLLAALAAPTLFGDDKSTEHRSNSGRSEKTAPTHPAPPATRTAPPATHQAPAPQVHPAPTTPQTNTTRQPMNAPNRPAYNAPQTNTTRQPMNTPNRPAYTPSQGGNNMPSRGTNTNPREMNTPGNRPNQPGGATGRTFGTGGNPSGNPSGNNTGRTFGNNGPRGSNNPRPAFHAPAGATMSRRPDGGATYAHNGMQYQTDRSGHLTTLSRPGMQANFAANGGVRSATFVRPGGARVSVSHGYYGERQVVTIRSDRTRIVSYGGGRGFVERPMARPGYVSRTYIYGGRTYVHVYRSYSFRGVVYYGYVPPVYYHPVFYGWAYNPWPRPIVFGWGWRASPWFGFYAGFFAPAPVYPTASLWLTDYLLAEDMRIAYENRQAAIAAQQAQQAQYYEAPPPPPATVPGGQVMLTPEVKAAIAEEVRQQLDAERAAANQPAGAPPAAVSPMSAQMPAALDPKQRIFVVSSGFAVNSNGQDCGLTPGDIIVRTTDQVSLNNTVSVSVLSSKPGDCPMNAMADVDVASLQEMHNQFQDHVDSGLKQLADNQGRNGLPPGPPPQPRQSPDGVAPADSAQNVQLALDQQQQDTNQALSEVQQQAAGGQ